MKPRYRELLRLPNLLSISRIILIGPALWLLHVETPASTILAFILIAAIISSDYFDGYFARKLDQVSETGKILDPVADKICVGAGALFMTLERGFPILLTIIIIGRDVAILAAAPFLKSYTGQTPASNVWGKYAVFFLAVALFVYAFRLEIFKLPATVLALVLIVISSASYIRAFRVQRRRARTGA